MSRQQQSELQTDFETTQGVPSNMATTMDSSILTETPNFNEKHQAMNDELDDDIAAIRAEIQALSKQRNMLSASLLSSTRIQKQLAEASTKDSLPAETQSLLSTSQGHAQENAHRLALGVTAFPFEDPSAEGSNQRLLGVRFDISDSHGKYDKPYYILAQRAASNGDDLRIYRHTIPAFVPLRKYEEMYLPQQDEGYGSGDTSSAPSQSQDLHGLVKHVRHDLVSWTQRQQAIRDLQQQLQLFARASGEIEQEEDEVQRDESAGLFGIKSLEATSVDAVQIKIEWAAGAVGRVKFSGKGIVERAVLYDHRGRMREAEMTLTMDSCSILDLATRLEAVHAQIQAQEEEDDEEMHESE